ncbi:class I SAM-dependent methyltransferase [Candidatus Pelagibacter communis]|uniref:class I SAM-dependent methyltransferase n=1 Tax=Pelagibacter ubique TaxID=198252 RepID=UPI00094CC783|nr:class I SAM-dependent methyltransferase [Candidatus Pelagibacter ubique]
MKINKCRACKKKNLKKLFSLGNMCFTGKFPRQDQKIEKKPITLVICNHCELVQLGHNFDLKYLYGPDYGYRTGINKTMTDHVKNITQTLAKKTYLKKNDIVLDIASNDGTLLNFYKKNIVKFGVDPILNKYKKNYKEIKYSVSSFFTAEKVKNKTNKKFKIITALSVFYDLVNPNKFLNDVKKLLLPEGVFLLEFADLASIIKYKMFDTICHEHLEYYSSKVIVNLIQNNGLRVFDIKQNNINGSSKQYFICHNNSKIKSKTRVIKKILLEEKKLKLNKVQSFKIFIKKINSLRKKLNDKLNSIRRNNETVHCYGASTKGNVLLQYFRIDNKKINFAAERNKNKYGLITPGSKIKIISEKLSRSMKPNYYLVLPWHFKKEILIREQLMRNKGTKFIFPLPKLEII